MSAESQPIQPSAAEAEATPAQVSEFESLLGQEFRVRGNDSRKQAVESAVRTLATQALQSTKLISGDSQRSIEAIIAGIDEKLTEQINQIIHHEDFKKLEGSWRGLHHLVVNTETDEMLKIRVLNISKKDLAKTLKNFPGALWDQSPIHKKLYEEEFGQPGGQPYACVIGDYEFDHRAPDVDLLNNIAKVAAAAHAPFIAAAAPTVMDMESWQELARPRDLTKIFEGPEYTQWRSMRAKDDSRYLGLTMPRYLARLPYGAKTDPVSEFAFEEDTEKGTHTNYVWSNAAYAMGVNLTRAFKLYGWCAQIRGPEGGGMVEGLPTHTFPTDDGGVDTKCPTEIAITDRREGELAKNGFIPLSHWKNTDFAVFMGAQSLNKPAEYTDPDATGNANMSARLPYLFAVCRFAHYLKVMVRDKVGTYKERDEMEKWLNDWINDYTVDSSSGEEAKAKYPLASAEVKVQEVPGNPGYYTSQFWLRPHYQLEGLKVSLRLVSKLPSLKNSGG